ncbi:MAG TPA: response regulator [Salinivirgaceae bacterium]|nr:response regulator [Salinivirgaceae bacterium]
MEGGEWKLEDGGYLKISLTLLVAMWKNIQIKYKARKLSGIKVCCLLITWALMIGFCELCLAQRTNVPVLNLAKNGGLSNGAVNSIIMDSEGYLWLGTWNGLNRWDGNHIVSYLPGSSPHSIHNHVIRKIFPLKEGGLWLLTNKGISRYNNREDEFKAYFDNIPGNLNYETDLSMTLMYDSVLFVSVKGRGLYQYVSEVKNFELREDIRDTLGVLKSLVSIQGSANGLVLLTTDGKVWRLQKEHLHLISRFRTNAPLVATFLFTQGEDEFFLLVQRNSPALMMSLKNGETWQLSIPGDYITHFATSHEDEEIWAGTELGNLYRLDLSKRIFREIYKSRDYAGEGLFTSRILEIYEPEGGGLWLGTDGNGAFAILPKCISNEPIPATRLSYPIVRSILRDGQLLLIGTKGGGLDIIGLDGHTKASFDTQKGMSNNSLLSMLKRPDGSIWLGTDGTGIGVLNASKTHIHPLFIPDIPPKLSSYASIYKMIDDGHGNVFAGTSGFGVIEISYDPHHPDKIYGLKQVELEKTTEGELQKQIVYALTQSRPGILWIGVRGKGVIRYNAVTKRVESVYSIRTRPDIIQNDDVISLFVDAKGIVWIGTSGGLFSLDPEANRAQTEYPNFKYRVIGCIIHSIQADPEDNLLLTTSDGIVVIDKERKKVRFFGQEDGLINEEYTDGAGYYDTSSRVYYAGGTRGIDRFRTEDIQLTSSFPPLAINALYINNQLQQPDGKILPFRANLIKTLRLKHHQNTLTFDVVAINSFGNRNHSISYRLLPDDKEWLIQSGKNGLVLSNLQPGDYILQLRVSDENGQWAPGYKEINIHIAPPFWITTWAFVLYFVILVSTQGIILWIFRRKAIRKHRLVLQKMEKQKELELQNYKLEFFTEIAHEFRTPLTVINAQTHQLLDELKETKFREKLLGIYRSNLKLQKLISEIIQFRKLEKGKEQLNISKVDPIEITEEVVSDIETLAVQRGIKFKIHRGELISSFFTDREKLQSILTNVISNATKYNREDGEVNIYIGGEGDGVKFIVEDEGEGFDPARISMVFEPFALNNPTTMKNYPAFYSSGLGLAVTRSMIDLLGGSIRAENKTGRGARIIFYIPSKENVFNEESSTEVLVTQDLDKNENQEPEKVSLTNTSGRKPLILIVEDEPEVMNVIVDVIKDDYRIITAQNGREALEMIHRWLPELIVSDVMMPEMDGIELCKAIRQDFDISHLPIILLTARTEIEDRISGLEAGADSYIPKPFHPRHLKVRIGKLLEMRRKLRENVGESCNSLAAFGQIPDPFLHKIITLIDENLDDQHLTAEFIADKMAISKSSLYAKCKSLTGVSPHELVNRRRLEKAALLLVSTHLTVSEIIDQVGFNSRTYFYDLFNRCYGCAPTEYRNKKSV